jgi:hypothetical protein
MRILGRDLKKIIKEEIDREMKQHASGEIQAEAEMHEEITPERDAYLKKTSPMYRAMMDPEVARSTLAKMNFQDDVDSGRTASTQPVMNFGTTEISPEHIRDIEDNLPEGESITDRLMERWLR